MVYFVIRPIVKTLYWFVALATVARDAKRTGGTNNDYIILYWFANRFGAGSRRL